MCPVSLIASQFKYISLIFNQKSESFYRCQVMSLISTYFANFEQRDAQYLFDILIVSAQGGVEYRPDPFLLDFRVNFLEVFNPSQIISSFSILARF